MLSPTGVAVLRLCYDALARGSSLDHHALTELVAGLDEAALREAVEFLAITVTSFLLEECAAVDVDQWLAGIGMKAARTTT